jgi:hypothetical protein
VGGTVIVSTRRWALAALMIAPTHASCEDDSGCVPDDQCGIVCDQATVLFEDGTPRERVDEINEEIGATVIRAPLLSAAYRIQLPSGMDFEEARDFYSSKPDVVAVTWATNYCPLDEALDTRFGTGANRI